MDASMTEDQFVDLLAAITEWSQTINQGWLEDDLNSKFGQQRWESLKSCGLTGLLNSQAVGGLGLNALQAARFMVCFGEQCLDGGLSFALCTHLCSTSLPLERFGSPALRERLLPGVVAGELIGAHAITEAESGSDAFAMSTQAVEYEGAGS